MHNTIQSVSSKLFLRREERPNLVKMHERVLLHRGRRGVEALDKS
jgi:hypothetical protein